jgi:hypothetical protein
MHYLTLTLAALFLAGLAAVVYAVKHAPEGFEDAKGYHPGQPSRRPRIATRQRHAQARELPTLLVSR